MQKEIEARIAICSYDQYPGNGAYKICFTSTALAAVDATRPYLEDRFNYIVHPYGDSTSCFNGEIIPKRIDKASGMDMICQYFGTDFHDAVAFGDSMNDYEMMKFAGASIAMGNACDELKEIANEVCRTVDEDGVYYAFIKMNFI